MMEWKEFITYKKEPEKVGTYLVKYADDFMGVLEYIKYSEYEYNGFFNRDYYYPTRLKEAKRLYQPLLEGEKNIIAYASISEEKEWNYGEAPRKYYGYILALVRNGVDYEFVIAHWNNKDECYYYLGYDSLIDMRRVEVKKWVSIPYFSNKGKDGTKPKSLDSKYFWEDTWNAKHYFREDSYYESGRFLAVHENGSVEKVDCILRTGYEEKYSGYYRYEEKYDAFLPSFTKDRIITLVEEGYI